MEVPPNRSAIGNLLARIERKNLPTQGDNLRAILGERAKVAPEQLERSAEYVGIVEARAKHFAEDITQENFDSLVEPLADTTQVRPVVELHQTVADLESMWGTAVTHDPRLEATIRQAGIQYTLNHAEVVSLRQTLQDRITQMSANPLQRIRYGFQISGLRSQIGHLDGYLATHSEIVSPISQQASQSAVRLQEAVDLVCTKARVGPEHGREKRPSKLEEELSKEGSIEELEQLWYADRIKGRFDQMKEKFLTKRRQQGISELDVVLDGVNFDHLVELVNKQVREDLEKGDWNSRETYEERTQVEENWTTLHRKFEDLGLGLDFDDFVRGIGKNEPLDESIRSLLPQRFETVDIKLPQDGYLIFSYFLNTLSYQRKLAAGSRMEGLQVQAVPAHEPHPNRELLRQLEDARQYINRWIPRDLLTALDNDALPEIPSLERWVTFRSWIVEKELEPTDKLDAFEDRLISRLAGVMLSGGGESWPGTYAAYALARLGLAKALPHFLYYQTAVSGASGLYTAGHTNAAAQRAMESLLRQRSVEEINNLGTPQFVKDSLQTLKTIAENPMGDEYGRSFLTAGMTSQRLREAIAEVRDHFEDPNYRPWLIALLRGSKNSQQPFSEDTYQAVLSILDLDNSASMHHEVINALAFRIHSQGVLGINEKINNDFPIAVDTLGKLLDRPDFPQDRYTFTALFHVMQTFEEAQIVLGLTEREITRIKLHYAQALQTRIGIPEGQQIEVALKTKQQLLDWLVKVMEQKDTPVEVQYITLQTFDLAGFDYPQTTKVVEGLVGNEELAEDANRERLIPGYIKKINFLKDINGHGFHACLADLLYQRTIKHGDRQAEELLISTFIDRTEARAGIIDWINSYMGEGGLTDEFIQRFENQLVEKLNLADTESATKAAIVELLDKRITYQRDKHARNLIFSLFENNLSLRPLLMGSIRSMIFGHMQWTGKEITPGNKYSEFGVETMNLLREKMRPFIDSADLTEQFWAVFTLCQFPKERENMKSYIEGLLAKSEELEKIIKGSAATLRSFLEKQE